MEIRNLKVAMHNLGCKVNSYEAEAMLKELHNAGAEIVGWEDFADVYIINTCSVTNIADRKSRQMLHKARAKNPEAVVIGSGCYVQAKAEELKKDVAVDILIGNNRKNAIVPILKAYTHREKEALSFVQDLSKDCAFEAMEGGGRTDRARAFVKVQDGCNQFCSYCIIPFVRGRIRSRTEEDTLREVEKLSKEGYQEIVLTGIHLSSYGLDYEHQNYEYARNHEIPSERLLSLIRAVAAVPGIQRVRLGSLEPRIITRNLVERLKEIPELCPHFHLSLQSGSDKTLRAMNRHYDTEAFRESVKLLRESWEDAAITTDVIVGFPGESEEDFADSYRFVEEMNFYELHVFRYSRREGTVADRMKEQVTEELKAERSRKMMELGDKCSVAFREKFLGKATELLVEELVQDGKEEFLAGCNPQYVKLRLPAENFPEPLGQIGKRIPVIGEKICKTYVLAKPV